MAIEIKTSLEVLWPLVVELLAQSAQTVEKEVF